MSPETADAFVIERYKRIKAAYKKGLKITAGITTIGAAIHIQCYNNIMSIYADKIFEEPIDKIIAFDTQSLKVAFEKIENYKTQYLLGYIRYEAKNCFLGKDYKSELPLLYFEVYESFKPFKPKHITTQPLLATKPLITDSQYSEALEQIKDNIAHGITYEVNYTYPTKVFSNLTEFELYQSLLENQTTPYNTFIKNQYETLLSFSPELFFTIKDNKITTKPMKGTVKRGATPEIDAQNIEFLKNDIKNKAENVMIVDLLRNDLSRIAKTGTVKVDKLFEIETHKTVHQMTSTISAELKENTTLYEVFESIFPCGSITGAPKISTMRVIDEVESYPRDIYCGAIGFISPEETVFSVPIRILQKPDNQKSYLCHTGGAIVWDSDTKDEWEETFIKRKFLNENEFHLIETMKVENSKILFLEEHLKRLKASAKYFGFKFDINDLIPQQDGILRLVLSQDGSYTTTYKELKPNITNKVTFAKTQTNSQNPFLYHKTDNRYWYNNSMEKIKNGEVYDEIYFNERGELTEGARSNIIIEKNGKLFTPPVSCGLLNGIYRQYLQPKEKILYKSDLLDCDRIYCVNSVRGMVEVKLCL